MDRAILIPISFLHISLVSDALKSTKDRTSLLQKVSNVANSAVSWSNFALPSHRTTAGTSVRARESSKIAFRHKLSIERQPKK